MGRTGMPCAVLKPEKTLSANELIEHCRKSLASYKIPRRVEFLDTDLPKNGPGKILKRVLRERFWADQKRAVN
jgi:long-chain acyl-CoA synthetase